MGLQLQWRELSERCRVDEAERIHKADHERILN